MSAPKWASVIVVAGLVLFLADSLSARPPKRPPDGPLITVYAPHPEQFELALDEIALDWGSHSGAPAQSAIAIAGTRVMEREAVLAWFAVTRAASPVDLLTVARALKAANPGADAHLVLYVPGHPKDKASRKLLTRQVGLILEPGVDPLNVLAGLPFVSIQPAAVSGGYVIEAEDPLAALTFAEGLRDRPGVKHAYPVIRHRVFPR